MPGYLRGQTALPNQVGTNTGASLSAAAKKIAGWLNQSLLISKDYVRSISVYLRRACPQLPRPRFDLGTLLSRIQPRGVVAGFLIVLVFVGSLDLAMRVTAIGTQPLVENSAFQHESQTPSESKVFSVSKSPEPMQGSISEPAPVSGAQIAGVPLPTRKPEGVYKVPNGKGAKANAATQKRMAQQKRARPKPMR